MSRVPRCTFLIRPGIIPTGSIPKILLAWSLILSLPARTSDCSTTAPLHQNIHVRLTINLEPDLYAVAKSLAKAEDCTISAAVNRLVRRSFHREAARRSRSSTRATKRNRFTVSSGRRPVTADTVGRAEAEDDIE